MMVEFSSATFEAIEGVCQGYTYDGIIYYSTDPDGKLRKAMAEYHIDDNMDLSADESTLKKDLTFYGFLDYTNVFVFGFEHPSIITMDPYAAGGNWHGSIKWLDDVTATFTLITNGELLDVTGTCEPYLASMEDGAPALMMDIVDEATGTGYTVLLYKHDGRELYRVQFLTSNGVPVLFQAVPTEIYN